MYVILLLDLPVLQPRKCLSQGLRKHVFEMQTLKYMAPQSSSLYGEMGA